MLFPTLPAELSREIGERGSNGEKEMLRHFLGTGFKWRKGNVEAFSGERGSNGEREMLRHFLENGVHNGDRELSSGDWGSNWRMGFIILAKQDVGVQLQRSGIICAKEKSRGSRKA